MRVCMCVCAFACDDVCFPDNYCDERNSFTLFSRNLGRPKQRPQFPSFTTMILFVRTRTCTRTYNNSKLARIVISCGGSGSGSGSQQACDGGGRAGWTMGCAPFSSALWTPAVFSHEAVHKVTPARPPLYGQMCHVGRICPKAPRNQRGGGGRKQSVGHGKFCCAFYF